METTLEGATVDEVADTVGLATGLTTPLSYADAAETLWGEAGRYIYQRYDHFRPLLPELPERLPIVIGLTAYGKCIGATLGCWAHGPRITIFSPLFGWGRGYVDDVIVHEMLHAWLMVTGRDTHHDSVDWYTHIARLSPAVLGHAIAIKRGAHRKSVRVPNPRADELGQPKTVVRKVATDAISHEVVTRWPHSFRPKGYDYGKPIECPTY
jgi:hypothetical protein